MFKIIISLLLMLLSLMMYFINHPLSMGLIILMQTMLTCLITGTLVNTYWFSYILFLTFLGGLLVLFIYVSSVASNEMFSFSMKWLYFMIFMIINLSLLLFLMKKNFTFYMNYDMKSFYDNIFMNNDYKINLSKLYNYHNFYFMLLLIIYLFITLLSAVKITNMFHGPIRSSK